MLFIAWFLSTATKRYPNVLEIDYMILKEA